MMMTSEAADLHQLAASILELLRRGRHVLVTAESCTAGLIAATLATVPGMSECFAGALVVYQTSSKVDWLGVPEDLIERFGVVSQEVAQCMAECALQKSSKATVTASITGYLGPDSPAELDGIAWLAIACRNRPTLSQMLILASTIPAYDARNAPEFTHPPATLRQVRQQDAVRQSLALLCRELGAQHES